LRQACERVIYQHVFSNAEREVGGVLVGNFPHEGAMPIVTGAIPAIAADEQRATLTFTQDAWEHIHRVLEDQFAGERIVGWYHSHPGFGIFLSNHDLFIHRNFFSGRSQIALVVDPIGCEEGVFAWRRSLEDVDLYTSGPTPAAWQAAASGAAAPTESIKRPRREKQKRGRRPRPPFLAATLAGLVAFVVAFGIAFAVTRPRSSPQRQPSRTQPAGTSATTTTSTSRSAGGGPASTTSGG
jgi:proteasome lid subunit RPN8/RPN11